LETVPSNYLPETGRLTNIATAAELVSAGISPSQIRTMVSRGELIRLNRGIYAPAELVRSVTATDRGALALRAAATLAPLGPQAVASHQTAARL
jgi:predicted transcriptional regulator of viral defense system